MAQGGLPAGLTAEARFHTRSNHVIFVMDKVTPGQVPLPVRRLNPVSIILPMLHLNTTLIRSPALQNKRSRVRFPIVTGIFH